jgi:outer membrane lipoprotein carrier protein
VSGLQGSSVRALRLLCAPVWLLLASAAGAAEPLEQLHAFLAQTSSARGDFTQQNPPTAPASAAPKGAAAAVVQVARGSFEFLRPGRFRWTYRTPYEQLIVSDGQHLFLYDKDLNQVTRKKLAGALPASPASILFGANDFEHDFQVQNDGSKDGIDWVRATPKARESMFESIRIGFQAAMPVAMELRDSFGQSTRLAFDHLQRNPGLPADRFQFTPPAGADVLEER